MDANQEKFSRIYDKYLEQIYRFVFLRVNDKEVAQDLTAETFSRGWESFRKDSGAIQNPRAFLYKIARNLTIDYYRAKGKAKIIAPEAIEYRLVDPRADLEQQAMLASEISNVRAAMSHLNEDYQNAIIWHYIDDLSIKEVSHLLNRSEGATRVLLHRAIEELRVRLS